MNVNFMDGYVISPYIIWGELDHRGFVTVGFEGEKDFENLDFLKKLKGRVQLLRLQSKEYLFFCFSLSEFSSKKSIFNLSGKELNQFYEQNYDDAQTAMCRLFYQLKSYSRQTVKPLQAKELGKLWQSYFHPLARHHKSFNPAKSILINSLAKSKLNSKAIGLELGSCLHHFVTVQTGEDYFQLISALKDYDLSAGISLGKCQQIYLHLYADSLKLIKEQAFELKSLLHSIGKTDYYQANEFSENLRLLERSLPGGYLA